MAKSEGDTEVLVEKIQSLRVADKVRIGTVALVNLIPYAGGAIASVIGEVAAQRKIEKVCDVLSDLNARLEERAVAPEAQLSKDQIIEVVYETLQTAAVTSDERKIESLKNGLGYAFVEDDPFARKQLFLEVLRGCTSLELSLLPIVYDSSDPYLVHEGQPPTDPARPFGTIAVSSFASVLQPQGEWRAVANRECGQEPLLKLLAARVGLDEAATEGAVRLLDGRGLSSAGPHLHRRDCKVLKWVAGGGGIFGLGASTITLPAADEARVQASPLEASRTQFGRAFLQFCRFR